MVEFKRHIRKKRQVDLEDLKALFESLDRKTSHTELRPPQLQALQELTRRRSERDLVLKISTGAGKTSVGLLWLFSHMEEKEEPAVYLCPTVQLVKQVMDEAQKLGVNATPYFGGERYPSTDAIAGKAILVCTYDKLFNAKTTFDRQDVHLRPCAIVLDDAHAGLEEVRSAFSLRISEEEPYRKLVKLLEPSCQKHNGGLWRDIANGDPKASMEVPYWILRPLIDEIQEALSSYVTSHPNSKEFVFVWPYVRDILRWCRCIIAGNGLEIVPVVLPVEMSRAYSRAKHRLFMSATLADDSILVRDLACDPAAAASPIRPRADRGLGERMVLAPALVDADLDRQWIMKLCGELSRKWRVVVLASSESQAREWEAHGARVFLGDDVSEAVKGLRDPASAVRFAVFPQRYDGVDLPDESCRILVIDGMPYGEGIVDRYDSNRSGLPGGIRGRLIHRLEQGMGRAVRSHVDYAVVLLSGGDLASFIARKDVLSSMNPDTRAQLDLALDLAKLAQDDVNEDKAQTVVEMIRQCLSRDAAWKQYYEENVRERAKTVKQEKKSSAIEMAAAEREAFELAGANSTTQAIAALQRALDGSSDLDEVEKAGYLQQIAFYQDVTDPGEALKTQSAAHSRNRSLLCPPGVAPRGATLENFKSNSALLSWFQQFEHANGAIAAIQYLRARLTYAASAETVEQALMELAALLGAIGSRPEREFGEGPDDLWLWPEISLVVEAKNQNEESLHKSDAGQLLLSLQWFGRAYAPRTAPVPVIVAKMDVADRKADFPSDARVLTPQKMNELLDQLQVLYRHLSENLPIMRQPHLIDAQLAAHGLLPKQFVSRYTVPLRERRK